MKKKLVTYTLDADGTIPPEIVDGGYFPKPVAGIPPKDLLLVGVLRDGASLGADMTEIQSMAALKAHLDDFTGSWKEIDNITALDTAKAAAMIFAKT